MIIKLLIINKKSMIFKRNLISKKINLVIRRKNITKFKRKNKGGKKDTLSWKNKKIRESNSWKGKKRASI
jgi:hypothetical protein